MPEQALATESPATLGAGATPVDTRVTVEDIPALFQDPEFTDAPHEERSAMLETAISGAYRDLSQGGMAPEDHVAFGEFVQKARKKNEASLGEKTMDTLRGAGESLIGLAKGAGALATELNPLRVVRTSGEGLKTTGRAAVNQLVGRAGNYEEAALSKFPEGKALERGVDDVLAQIDKGEAYHKTPEEQTAWLKEQADKLKPLQHKYHMGGIDRMELSPEALALATPAAEESAKAITAANGLDNPENVALLTTYMATRSPRAKAELKANLFRTGQNAAVAKEREAILNSPGAQEFERTFGKGSAQHLYSGADPVNVAMLALPFLRGAGAIGEGASALAKAGTFGAEQTAFGVDSAIQQNPSDPNYAEGITDMLALGGVMHGAGRVLKAAIGKGPEPPPLPTERPPAELVTDSEGMPLEARTADTDAVAGELFGNTGREPTADASVPEPAPVAPGMEGASDAEFVAAEAKVAPPAAAAPVEPTAPQPDAASQVEASIAASEAHRAEIDAKAASEAPASEVASPEDAVAQLEEGRGFTKTEVPPATERGFAQLPEELNPRARMAQRILENQGIEPEVAKHMATVLHEELPPDLPSEDFRAGVLVEFSNRGGRFPGANESGAVLNEDPAYWERQGHSPEAAQAAAKNSADWRAKDEQVSAEQNRQLLEKKGFTNTQVPSRKGGFVQLPKGLAEMLDHGSKLIRDGVKDFAKWSVEMIKKFGEAIKAYLKDVWAAATARDRLTGKRGVGALNSNAFHNAKASVKQAVSVGEMKDDLSKIHDAAQNRPGWTARQAGNHIRQRFGMKSGKDVTPEQDRDMRAAAFVTESFIAAESQRAAAGLPKGASVAEAKAALSQQVADVQTNAPDKLKNKYVPQMLHGLANFDDIHNKGSTAQQLLHAEQIQEQSYGIKQEHLDNYLSHVYSNINEIKGKKAANPLFGGGSRGAGSSRYFVKGRTMATLADAIQSGYDPQSTNIADLAEHRIMHGQVLVEQANAREQMMSAIDPDSGERIVRPHLDRDYYEINSGRGTAVQGVIYPTANKFAVEQGGTRILYPDLASAKVAATSGGQKLSYKRTGTGNLHPDYRTVDMAGTKVQVYSPYEGLMTALYGRDSIVRHHIAGRALLRGAQVIKHAQVLVDIVHVANVMYTQIFGGGGFGYGKGLAILEHSPSDMQRMRASGEIDRPTFDYYQKNRPLLDAGIKAGLNVGRIADAIYADSVKGIGDWLKQNHMGLIGHPIAKLGEFAPWVFQKLTRGAMVQTFLKFQDRYLGFGMSMEEASSAAATEVNRAFGNLGMQGWLKSRGAQDVARIALFAPQWAEGRLRMEGQGIGQILKILPDSVRAKKLRVGNVARMQIGAALTFLALAQAINLATTGHSTFDNEEGHKLDAWIPGGAHGMWLSPFNVLAHNTEALHRYYNDTQSRTGGDKMLAAKGAAQQIFQNKLSAPMRALQVFTTQKDYAGTPLQTAGGVGWETALTLAPLPIPITSLMRHGPGESPQFTLSGAQPGALEKQAFASLGIHVVNARGPQDKMYSLARPFRKDDSYHPEASKYTQIRRDLKGGFTDDAKDRMIDLITSGAAALANMDEAMGMRGGSYERPLFAGTQAAEHAMRSSLGPTDKKLYEDAVAEHREQAHQYWNLRNSILSQLRDAGRAGKDALARKKQAAKDGLAD